VSLGERFRRKCNPEVGDLLIVSRGATIGRLCRVEIPEPFCLMGSVILVKPKRTLIDSRYLSSLLKHPFTYAQLYKTSGSSAQQAIYIKDVRRLVCIVPPLKLQHEFTHRLEIIERMKSVQRIALEELDVLFASLQHRAFQGQL